VSPPGTASGPDVDTGSSAREDWWSVALGLVLLAGAVAGLVGAPPAIGSWETSPLAAVPGSVAAGLLILLVGLGALTAVAVAASGGPWRAYLAGFPLVLGLAVLAKLIGAQATLHAYGLSYALWALALGLLVANTTGTPAWLLAGARSELFIKTGLVVLGAEILAGRIVTLGAPGLLVAYAVTPVVIVFMWRVGTRVLRMASPALVMVIACATSVCGVSAAIAAAAATRAKREELTLAVGMTMIFTVLMMVGMPAISRAIGLTNAVAGAWVGGTVDSTGAVVVAGAMLGAEAEQVAAVVKMIQNTMIGGIAFLIAVYWVTVVERDAGGARPGVIEVWRRFPKFVLGFVGASLVFSFVFVPVLGEPAVTAITKITKGLRGWLFALAFTAIGLEADFRKLARQVVGGKPIVLYATGQTFNVILTLIAAQLAFGALAGGD
jgi:uncharacterized membrane protein YadS